MITGQGYFKTIRNFFVIVTERQKFSFSDFRIQRKQMNTQMQIKAPLT